MVHLPLRTLLWALPLVLGALSVHADKIKFGGPPGINHRYLGAAKNGAQIAQVYQAEMDTLENSFFKIRNGPALVQPVGNHRYNAECYVEMCVEPDMSPLLAGRYLSHLAQSKNQPMDRIDVTAAVPGHTPGPSSGPWTTKQGDVSLCGGGRKKIRARHYVDKLQAPPGNPQRCVNTSVVGNEDGYSSIGVCCYTKAVK